MITKEDLKATLEAMTEETEGMVFFSETSESVRFQILPNMVIYVNNDKAKALVDGQIMDMCFMLTGDTVLPENLGSEYLQTFPVDEKTIKDHVEALISYEVVSEESALIAFNDLRDTFNRSLGRYAGHLMRHYPSIDEGIHPFTVARTEFSCIPKNMVKNCSEIWVHMPHEERGRFSDSVEAYTKFVYCSAVDQLNRAIYSLKEGAASARISLCHPGNLPLPDFSEKEQPILDRVSAYAFLDSLHFWLSPGTKDLTLQVRLKPCRIQVVYYMVLPMFSFLLSKVAADCGLVPSSLEIVTDLTYIESAADAKELLGTLLTDNAISTMPIPEYVPNKPAVDFTTEDLQNKKES